MRVACVLASSFAVAVERQVDPRLDDQPLVVYDRHGVFDASSDTGGVRRGLPLRQAKALCPHAVFVEANHSLYRDVAEAMLDALESVAPLVEPAGLGAAYADIRGLHGHYKDEFALARTLGEVTRDATGLLPSVSVADGKFVSWVAASLTPRGDAGIVLPGREQEFLQDNPIDLLPFSPEVLQRLYLLALHTLGDVAALPPSALQAQFGSNGRRLWELARGIDCEPIRPRKREEVLIERLNFEAPVVASEALAWGARQLVGRLVRRLRGRTARRMHVQLLADERIVWERWEPFREPTGDDGRIVLVLKTQLALLTLTQPVEAIVITLTGISHEVGKQARLFSDANPNLNQLAEAIRQLRARYGRDTVDRIVEVDPWSRHPEERWALVPYDA